MVDIFTLEMKHEKNLDVTFDQHHDVNTDSTRDLISVKWSLILDHDGSRSLKMGSTVRTSCCWLEVFFHFNFNFLFIHLILQKPEQLGSGVAVLVC